MANHGFQKIIHVYLLGTFFLHLGGPKEQFGTRTKIVISVLERPN